MRAIRRASLVLSLLVAATLCAGSQEETTLTLWSTANPRLTIVAPAGDIAAERLQSHLAERGVRDVSVRALDDGAGNVVFVGTPQTNAALRGFLKKAGKLEL